MSARFLAWYSCVLLSLASVLLLLVSVGPGAEARFAVIQAVIGGAAVCFALVGAGLGRMPKEHWSNRSLAVRSGLLAAATLSTLLVLGIAI